MAVSRWVSRVGLLVAGLAMALAAAEATAAEGGAQATPGSRLFVRVSRDSVLSGKTKTFAREQPLRDQVLGAAVTGKSNTRGSYVVRPRLSADDAGFVVDVTGTSVATTAGVKGPVTVHTTATTTFTAYTDIKFDRQKGFYAGDVHVTAQTRCKTNGIDSQRQGLIGRVVRRSAARQVERTRAEATEISRQKAIARVESSVAKNVADRVTQMNEPLKRLETIVSLVDPNLKQAWFLGVCDDSLVFAFTPVDEKAVESVALRELPSLRAPYELWVHEPSMPQRVSDQLVLYLKARDAASTLFDSTRRFLSLAATPQAAVQKPALANSSHIGRHGEWLYLRIAGKDRAPEGAATTAKF